MREQRVAQGDHRVAGNEPGPHIKTSSCRKTDGDMHHFTLVERGRGGMKIGNKTQWDTWIDREFVIGGNPAQALDNPWG